MNNKGFAITGILYTLFILFMLTLFAVLSGLSTREKMMSKSIDIYDEEEKYIYNRIDDNYSSYGGVAKYDGFYIFVHNTLHFYCGAYLKKGTNFSDVSFIKKSNTDNCVKYDENFQLSEVYIR